MSAWSQKSILQIIFNWLCSFSDKGWLFIDGSIVRAHQHSAEAASNNDEVIGKSYGGHSTKIYLIVDSYDLSVNFKLSGEQVNDSVHE